MSAGNAHEAPTLIFALQNALRKLAHEHIATLSSAFNAAGVYSVDDMITYGSEDFLVWRAYVLCATLSLLHTRVGMHRSQGRLARSTS